MLVIRLRRIGRKNDPHYRIVVAEHTAPVQGKFIAEVGHYHPKTKETVIREDQLRDWLGKGAKPSNTVAKICARQNIALDGAEIKQFQGQPKKKAQEMAKAKADKSAAAQAQPEAPDEPAEAENVEEETGTEEIAAEEASADETPEETSEETTEEAPAEESSDTETNE